MNISHLANRKAKVRTITALVEACASRLHLDCIVEIMKAREATGTPYAPLSAPTKGRTARC